jgi:hypothetical protein
MPGGTRPFKGDKIMTSKTRLTPAVVFLVFFSLSLNIFMPSPGFAGSDEDRTVSRTVFGRIIYPERFFAKPDHYEFLSMNSNRDPHPHAGDGQAWDTRQWNSWWTPEAAVKKLFKARIFERQYMRNGQIPVVELGPAFYQLSDIDKRRTLKLLTDYDAIFKQGYGMVELVDWLTSGFIGAYTPRGMFLN